jgi:hypothetical protein
VTFRALSETLDFFYALQRATSKRRFFVSEMGLMGLALEETEEIDLLVAFLGSQLPFVVRKSNEDEYVIIGERRVDSSCLVLSVGI